MAKKQNKDDKEMDEVFGLIDKLAELVDNAVNENYCPDCRMCLVILMLLNATQTINFHEKLGILSEVQHTLNKLHKKS